VNLLALAERWGEAITSKPFGFAAERCLHSADKFAACTACYDVCPADAIQPGEPPAFVSESCQACRACLPVCPVGAFTADDEVQALLHCAERIAPKPCEVVCGLNPQVETGIPGATAVRVRGCLAGLGVAAYLGLVSQGIEKVVVRLDACADCPWSQLQSQIEAQVQQAQSLLALWGWAAAVHCFDEAADGWGKRPFWNAASPPVSRRDLFRSQADEKKSEAADSSEPSQFHERLRFLRAVKQLPAPTGNLATTSLAGLGFALVAVKDDCTACGVCVRACPTDALQMETAESSYQLIFSPQICLACDICSHVCAPNAISLTHDPTFDQVFAAEVDQVVQRGCLTSCSKCRAPFAARADTGLCPVCEFRCQNPFGSIIPPGLAAKQRQKNLTETRRIKL
jgi:NAD-dependent dihydropyrimidine dehydrogenase PreA subunit